VVRRFFHLVHHENAVLLLQFEEIEEPFEKKDMVFP
jgi:hypothetical protein